jgi:hypothetical protein
MVVEDVIYGGRLMVRYVIPDADSDHGGLPLSGYREASR